MITILFIRNIFITILNIISIVETIKKKNVKKILLFVCIYLFLNLFIYPTYALCEIDPDLLDREHNTYNGSKIILETEDEIYTEEDRQLVIKYCDMMLILLGAALALNIAYMLTH